MTIPEGLHYTAEHEWLRMEGDEAVIGVTDFAQHALGDVTYVELPKVGRAVRAREALAMVESVKAASDVYAPVAGTVAAVNDALAGAPQKINEAPYGAGWICRLKGVDAAEVGGLLKAQQYRELAAEEP